MERLDAECQRTKNAAINCSAVALAILAVARARLSQFTNLNILAFSLSDNATNPFFCFFLKIVGVGTACAVE